MMYYFIVYFTEVPTLPPKEMLIQLRILSLSCSLWNVRCQLDNTVDTV